MRILVRLAQIPATILVLMILIFVVIRLTPGDPARMISPLADPVEVDKLREFMGIDQPIHIQFIGFVQHVATGDMGMSLFLHRPVTEVVVAPFLETLKLVTFTMAMVLIIGVPVGVFSAVARGSLTGTLTRALIYFGQAAPNFWLGIMLILVFGVRLRLLPVYGSGSFKHIILPAVALGVPLMARVVRFVRSEMLSVMHQDYIRTARSKGLGSRQVVGVHAFRNVLIPLVTDTGLQFGWLFASAVAVEVVFGWPGIGALAIQAMISRDYPLVQACVLVLSTVFVVVNFFVDIAYGYIDPRIRTA